MKQTIDKIILVELYLTQKHLQVTSKINLFHLTTDEINNLLIKFNNINTLLDINTDDNDNILLLKLFRDIKVTFLDMEKYNDYHNDEWANFINNKVHNNTFTFYEAFEWADYPCTLFVWFNDDKTAFICLSIYNYKLPENLSLVGDIIFTEAVINTLRNNDFSNYLAYKTTGSGHDVVADNSPSNLRLSRFSNDSFIIKDMDDLLYSLQFID